MSRRYRFSYPSEGTKDTCPPLVMDDPVTRIQVAAPGKNASDPFSTGVVLNITCAEGHRLNVGNRSVKCNKRGVWKPDRPVCLLSKSCPSRVGNLMKTYEKIWFQFLARSPILRTQHSVTATKWCRPERRSPTMRRPTLDVDSATSFKAPRSTGVLSASSNTPTTKSLNAFQVSAIRTHFRIFGTY